MDKQFCCEKCAMLVMENGGELDDSKYLTGKERCAVCGLKKNAYAVLVKLTGGSK